MRERLMWCCVLFLFTGAVEASTNAWVYANNATATSYSPAAASAYNPIGGSITITHSATGAYNVRFQGLAPMVHGAGNVQITPGLSQAQAPVICRMGPWGTGGQDVFINVNCTTLAGVPTDAFYSILFTFN